MGHQQQLKLYHDYLLEHLRNGEELLTKCKAALKPGGFVCLSVPNIAHWSIRWSLLFGKFNYTPSGALDKTHVHFYTLDNLRAVAEDCGYEIIEEHSVLDFPAWIDFIFRRFSVIEPITRRWLRKRFKRLLAVQFQIKIKPK